MKNDFPSSLVVAEITPQGTLAPVTARVVAALAPLAPAGVTLLVAGKDGADAARQGARLTGVARVVLTDAPGLHGQPPEAMTDLLHALAVPPAADYDLIAAPAGAMGRDALPRLAARLDVGMASEVVALHDARTFSSPTHGGQALRRIRLSTRPAILSVRPSAFAPAPERPADHPPAPVEFFSHAPVKDVAPFTAFNPTPGERPPLTNARVIVAGGLGAGSAEGFGLIEALADRLGAAVGASRGAVDAGWAPNDWQIGQTGKVVGPDLYIAAGISGSLQHLAGVKDARCIVAINRDPAAPIHAAADFSLVADLHEAIPQLLALLPLSSPK